MGGGEFNFKVQKGEKGGVRERGKGVGGRGAQTMKYHAFFYCQILMAHP